MRPIGVGTVTIGLAFVAGAAAAQAQTAVTRQITSEPVETVITQGPNGTAVTRRILTPEPGFDGGTQLGKRYTDETGGLELLCTKGGPSSLSVGDVVLQIKDAKPLPSSD